MLVEARQIPISLYNQFKEARTGATKAFIPLGVATAVNFAAFAAVSLLNNEDVNKLYGQFGDIGAAAEVGTLALGWRRYSRYGARLGEIASQIAEAEDRPIESEIDEVRRIDSTLRLAAHLTRDFSRFTWRPKTLGDRARAAKQDARVSNAQTAMIDQFLTEGEIYESNNSKDEVKQTALILAENHWDTIAEDTTQPDRRRRYAYQMRMRLRRFLPQV